MAGLPAQPRPPDPSGVAVPATYPVGVLAATALITAVPILLVEGADYGSTSDFHAAMEMIGGLIGFIAGVTFLVRFAVLADRLHLVFGLAFFANGAFDLVHGLLPFLAERGWFLIPEEAIIRAVPATYVAGRLAMAGLLVAAPVLARRVPQRLTGSRLTVLAALAVVVASATIALFLSFFPGPATVMPDRTVPRPLDLVTGVMFALAAVILLRVHRETEEPLTWWVAAAATLAAVGQLAMGFSVRLHGPLFDLAHLYKVAAYALPLLGLSLYQVRALAERQRYTRELERVNRLRTEVVSIVSHELRTPLAAIRGFGDLLTDDWESIPEPTRRDHVEQIARQSARLHHLTEDLLALTRLEAGTVRPHLKPVEVGRVIADARRQLPGLDEVEVEVGDDACVLADPGLLNEIVLNYLDNACVHGEPPVRVETREAGEMLDIVVSDQGSGVSEEFVAELFESFTQAEGGTIRREGGAGLGLAIVRGMAHALGGRAWYEPNEPRGARFVVRLPKAGADAAAR